MKKGFILLIVYMLLSSFLFAGPFGLEFGWSKGEMEESGVKILYENEIDNGTTWYIIEPNEQDSYFKRYTACIHSDYGIYEIVAVTENISSSSQLMRLYRNIVMQLTLSYGAPESHNQEHENKANVIEELYNDEYSIYSLWNPDAIKGTDIAYVFYGLFSEEEASAHAHLAYNSLDYNNIVELT